jgi:ribosome-associated translation inhibitor RaiA
VSRASAEHQAQEDTYVAIRDAFDAAERQLEHYAHEMRAKHARSRRLVA